MNHYFFLKSRTKNHGASYGPRNTVIIQLLNKERAQGRTVTAPNHETEIKSVWKMGGDDTKKY